MFPKDVTFLLKRNKPTYYSIFMNTIFPEVPLVIELILLSCTYEHSDEVSKDLSCTKKVQAFEKLYHMDWSKMKVP